MKFDEKVERVLNDGESKLEFINKLNKAPNIIVDSYMLDIIEHIDEVEFTIKKFPVMSVDNWEGELESDIKENYSNLSFGGSTKTGEIDLYYFGSGLDQLEKFLKDYKVKI